MRHAAPCWDEQPNRSACEQCVRVPCLGPFVHRQRQDSAAEPGARGTAAVHRGGVRVRSPRLGRKSKEWTAADRHYEQLRISMQPLFQELGIAA
jgi:hypothetical protein